MNKNILQSDLNSVLEETSLSLIAVSTHLYCRLNNTYKATSISGQNACNYVLVLWFLSLPSISVVQMFMLFSNYVIFVFFCIVNFKCNGCLKSFNYWSPIMLKDTQLIAMH